MKPDPCSTSGNGHFNCLRPLGKAFVMILFGGLLAACTSGKPDKLTGANLLEAYNGESTVSSRYRDYALQAGKEGIPLLENFFRALSRSEEIHASNHRAALASLGITVDSPDISKYPVKTTAENLTYSIAGEIWEADTMYAGFIAQAMDESREYAAEVLTWARDTEVKHARQLKEAVEFLKSGLPDGFPSTWYVCRKCGNTFAMGTEEDPCPFCDTPFAEFEVFSVPEGSQK